MKRSWCLFLLLYLLFQAKPNAGADEDSDDIANNQVKLCSCRKSCLHSLKGQVNMVSLPSGGAGSVSSQLSYFYDSKTSSCVELSGPCEMSPSCVFESQQECLVQCHTDASSEGIKEGKSEGCGAAGCCADGSPRTSIGKCGAEKDIQKSGNAAPPSSSSHGYRVRWDLVATGLSVLILLVAVLSISGIMAYHYREKQKERIRSRYIHNVLEMYDSGSESSASESAGKVTFEAAKDSAADTQLFAKA